MKKIISIICACALIFGSINAFAQPPQYYDNQTYESIGYTSIDPDGEMNLAVIANNNVKVMETFTLIDGSIYSNGNIYFADGYGNAVNGLLISGTESSIDVDEINNLSHVCEGYIHTNTSGTRDNITYYSVKPEYKGSINDKNTSFNYSYDGFIIPEIANVIDEIELNVYNNSAKTINEDTYMKMVTMNGSYGPALTIDTTNKDVTVVIDEITSNSQNINIRVIGDNKAYIYIKKLPDNIPFLVNKDNTKWPIEDKGSIDNTYIYIDNDVNFSNAQISAKEINTNNNIKILGSSNIHSNINTKANEVLIDNRSDLYGTLYAPTASTKITGSSALYGQLYTDSLLLNGCGRIIYQKDDAITKNNDIKIEKGIDLTGITYAYIFGYEPEITEDKTSIYMGLDDYVTIEQVSAMITRMVDQKYNSYNKIYPITDKTNAYTDTWFIRGLTYVDSKGGFSKPVQLGNITRAEVANLIVKSLDLNATGNFNYYNDIENNIYKNEINTITAYGYMEGIEDKIFNPDSYMTRAEFCQLFNNIIGRTEASLVTTDGIKITPEIYSIVDMNPNHWAYETCLRATSAYDKDGFVDLQLRQNNIRNKLDQFNGQIEY